MTDELEPMEVQRIDTGDGSHVDPPLNQSWSNLEKLRWHAGVVKADCGVEVYVMPGARSERAVLGLVGPHKTRWDLFAIRVGNTSASAYDFNAAWDYLNGIEMGASAVRREKAA